MKNTENSIASNSIIASVIKHKRQIISLILVFAVFFLMSFLINEKIIDRYMSNLIILSCINIILAVSLNLITGITGQLSLGNAAFMAIGAYSSAFFTVTLKLPFIPSVLIGAIFAGAIALVVGIPTLKLKGDYFAIATLGICEIVRVLITNMDFLGGASGFQRIGKDTTFMVSYFTAVFVVIIVVNIVKSTKGRALLAIRDNEIAAEAMGVDTTKYKVTSFLLSAMIAGVAGGLFSHYTGYIVPDTFNFLKSIEIVTFVVLGGMGSITGSIIAAVVLTILPELLRFFSDYRMIFYSVALVLLMIFRPQGLMGTLELEDIIKLVTNKLKKKKLNKNITDSENDTAILEKEIVKEG